MNSEIELKQLKKEITELKKQVAILKGEDGNKIPTYQYTQIRDTELKKLFEIEHKLFDNQYIILYNLIVAPQLSYQ